MENSASVRAEKIIICCACIDL